MLCWQALKRHFFLRDYASSEIKIAEFFNTETFHKTMELSTALKAHTHLDVELKPLRGEADGVSKVN